MKQWTFCLFEANRKPQIILKKKQKKKKKKQPMSTCFIKHIFHVNLKKIIRSQFKLISSQNEKKKTRKKKTTAPAVTTH